MIRLMTWGAMMPTKRSIKHSITGTDLKSSAATAALMAREVNRMVAGMSREIRAIIRDAYAVPDIEERQLIEVMDAKRDFNPVEIIAQKLGQMLDRWAAIFDEGAKVVAEKMINATIGRSNRELSKSLKDVSLDLTLKPTPAFTTYMDAATQEAAALIKRVPGEFIPNVQQDVMRSITQGRGLQDLIADLDKREVKVKNWSKNVARDQTRKAYATVNRVRLQEAGVRKFKWIHSGGSNEPRQHHLKRWPAGLNGGIFSFDDPPIIDPKTGEKGLPGQLPYCGCTFAPHIDLEEGDDE
ncbi:MAG: hypothetical protein [Bacteriophage sp.]|nr:MAG: hypothetical protein [Bacteriophage sp.]